MLDDFDPIFQHFERPSTFDELIEILGLNEESRPISNELKNVLSIETNFPNMTNSLDKTADVIVEQIQSAGNKKRKFLNLLIITLIREIDALYVFLKKCFRNYEDQSCNFSLGKRRRMFIDSLSN